MSTEQALCQLAEKLRSTAMRSAQSMMVQGPVDYADNASPPGQHGCWHVSGNPGYLIGKIPLI